jgi:hypothetical protein
MAKWKTLIGTLAPTIAATFGGPLAGAGVAAISRAVLGSDAGTETDIAEMLLGGDPEVFAKVKTAEIEFKAKMKELEIDVIRLAKEDRESARSMQTRTKSIAPGLIATMIFAGFFGITAALMFVEVPDQSLSILQILLGALSAGVVQVLNFYFGSSAGSKQKTDILNKVVNGKSRSSIDVQTSSM